jgi:DNA-binding transcriptional regulator YiaG
MIITPDSTKLTFAWELTDIQTAFDNHQLFLRAGELTEAKLKQLQHLSPKTRRAARTIAEVAMPPAVTVPEDAGDCARLPAADAVVVQSSIENWSGYTADDGIGVAHEHLTDLGQLYDLRAVFSEDQSMETQLVAHAVFDPIEAARAAYRLAQLIAAGEGDTSFAHGLAGAMANHTQREVAATVPVKEIIQWRGKLALDPKDLARMSEIEPSHLDAIETGAAQPTRAETRRLTDVINAKRREAAAHT